MRGRNSLFLLTCTAFLLCSCSAQKSIRTYQKLESVQTVLWTKYKPFAKSISSRNDCNNRSPQKVAIWRFPLFVKGVSKLKTVANRKSRSYSSLVKRAQTKLRQKAKTSCPANDPERTVEKWGIIGFCAGIIGAVGLFAINYLPIIFVAAVIATLGGLVSVIRSKDKYMLKGFGAASLALGLIILLILGVIL
jgi:hypothetical protein